MEELRDSLYNQIIWRDSDQDMIRYLEEETNTDWQFNACEAEEFRQKALEILRELKYFKCPVCGEEFILKKSVNSYIVASVEEKRVLCYISLFHDYQYVFTCPYCSGQIYIPNQ